MISTRIMKLSEFDNAVFYRLACGCDADFHDKELNKIFLHFCQLPWRQAPRLGEKFVPTNDWNLILTGLLTRPLPSRSNTYSMFWLLLMTSLVSWDFKTPG